MKINRVLIPLLLLSSAIGIYVPIKATTNNLAYQEEEKTSAYPPSSYTHGTIHLPDPKKIESVSLKAGLLKMYEEAIAAPYTNTDVHNTCIAYWLRNSNIRLLQSEIELIIHYTGDQRPVYFFLGPTGAGKSTAIFALQGNEVSREEKEESDDEDINALLTQNDDKKTNLIVNATVQVKIPKIGHSTEGETVGAIVYYPGDSRQNIAFCDTEGFLGERSDVSEAEKCISAFAPFFALKTNTIGGIIVVVSAHDILSGRGDMFKSSAHFLRAYFSAAGPQALKASLLLMITQCDNNKTKVKRALRNMIQKSHQAYFKVLEQVTQNNSHDNKKAEDTGTKETDIAELQPFFKMLLEAPVCQGKEDEIKNFRFDNEKMFFFDPCSEGSIRKTWHKLSTLKTLHDSHLCCFDNSLSQYLRAQILEIGDEVKKKAASILRLQQRIKIQAAQLKAAKYKETLQPLIDQLQHEISTLNQENQAHRKDDKLICVFEEHHIEKLHLSRKGVVLDDTTREGRRAIVNAVANRQGVHKMGVGAVGGTIAGVAMGAGAVLGAGAGAVLGATVAIGMGMWKKAKEIEELAYCKKIFSYSGAAPIYQIVATYENAELSHITPKESVVKEHFDIDQTVDEATIRYTATVKSTSLKKDKWEFRHVTGPFKDANCKIKMYAKKNELTSTRKLLADNVQKIKNKQTSIAACLQAQNDVVSLKHSYENDQQALQKLNSQFISEQKATFDMLNTWARDIFRADSQDLVLLKSYLSDFASAAELPLTIKQQTQKPLQPYQLAEGLDAMPSYNSESDQAVPLLPGQLLIPANGQCLYTTIIMGYLLPVKQTPDKVTTRIDQLFGMQPADYINELSQNLENLTYYLTYLHSDRFSILVTAFMKRMQIKKGTWGGSHEIQAIATKLNVNIQVYYPDPNNRTNLVQSDLTKPAAANADITLHIVQDKVHPAEVRTQTQKASAEDNPHYQHYRLKYTLLSV